MYSIILFDWEQSYIKNIKFQIELFFLNLTFYYYCLKIQKKKKNDPKIKAYLKF